MDPPNIFIVEWGGKRHKPSSSPSVIGVNQAEVDQPAAESEDTKEVGPGTTDEFPALENRRNINKNGTTYDMVWAAM